MTPSRAILLAIAGVLAIANLNLWALNVIDRSIDRQAEARRLVMVEKRTGDVFHCYAAKRKERGQ